MGFFNRKTEIFERNAQIAQLRVDLEDLQAKNEQLSIENAELRAEVANLKSTNTAIINDNSVLEGRVLSLQAQIESLKKSAPSEDSLAAEDKKKASELKMAATREYALELKRLKFFCDKFKDKYCDASVATKAEISEILTDILNKHANDKTTDVKAAVDELYGAFKIEENKAESEAVDFEFDLDAVINPKTELDLEQLCRELGVYKG